MSLTPEELLSVVMGQADEALRARYEAERLDPNSSTSRALNAAQRWAETKFKPVVPREPETLRIESAKPAAPRLLGKAAFGSGRQSAASASVTDLLLVLQGSASAATRDAVRRALADPTSALSSDLKKLLDSDPKA